LNELSALRAVAAAARRVRHWHDADNDGMVVSGESVRALWAALETLDSVSPVSWPVTDETDGSESCICHRCIKEKGLKAELNFGAHTLPLNCTRMIVCGQCGNKRCPRASDHRLACTGSNASGQAGSVHR
jgi:hypothetical protein